MKIKKIFTTLLFTLTLVFVAALVSAAVHGNPAQAAGFRAIKPPQVTGGVIVEACAQQKQAVFIAARRVRFEGRDTSLGTAVFTDVQTGERVTVPSAMIDTCFTPGVRATVTITAENPLF